MELSLERLKELGRLAGFDAVGATSADPFDEMTEVLKDYAERGRTGFEHEDIALRVNPKQWMPEAQSLIAVAMAYLTPQGQRVAKQHPKERPAGRISVYSYGEDYHRVMSERLDILKNLLETELGRPVCAQKAVDTSPLVDRRVAERAGIGWIGKNCMFYTPSHGSFVFLGTLLVDVSIEAAQAAQVNRCGTCSLCMQACPTQALIAPGVIDATRCLSYITQMKGSIPEPYRAKMGTRVWGCDTCQWACPENKPVEASPHERYRPVEELAYPDLVELLYLSNREFMRRYGKSAAAWRGVRTLQRNALIALGNLKNPEAVVHLAKFLRHERSEFRTSAAWSLRRIGGEAARLAVAQALQVEEDEQVKREMVWAVEKEGVNPDIPSLGTSEPNCK